MNVLSLFDGMSCGRIALERAEIKVDNYYSSEIDKYAIQIADKNYPQDTKNRLGDVTKWKEWDIDWDSIDLVIGGSPCQSLSITQSKTRLNLDGKSKLFFDFFDIYSKALKHNSKVKYVFENVESMSTESRDTMSSLFKSEPIMIDSSLVSAQQRKRYYWTNIDNITQPASKNIVLKDIMDTNVDSKFFYKKDFIYHGDKCVAATLDLKGHDILKRVHSPNFKCHTLTTCNGGNLQKKVLDNGKPRKLTPLEYERLQTVPDNYTEGVSNTQRYNMLGNGWTVDVIAHIFKGLK